MQSARPFGYGPRKFYEMSHLVKGPVDVKPDPDQKKKKEPEPQQPELKPEEKEKEKKLKRIYIAMTSDRGR